MRRSRYTEDEILFFLAEADNGIPVEAICASAGISERTFYRWRERYEGLTTQAAHRLHRLEEENRALRRQLAKSTGAPLQHPAHREPMRIRSDSGAVRTDRPDSSKPGDSRPVREMRGAIVGRFASLRTGR